MNKWSVKPKGPTEAEIKAAEDRARSAGVLCCSLCNKPSGIWKMTLHKQPDGTYVCNWCLGKDASGHPLERS